MPLTDDQRFRATESADVLRRRAAGCADPFDAGIFTRAADSIVELLAEVDALQALEYDEPGPEGFRF